MAGRGARRAPLTPVAIGRGRRTDSHRTFAEANDVQVVIDALVAEVAGHLDLAVEDGRLTEDEAAARLAEMAERVTDRVHGERPLGR